MASGAVIVTERPGMSVMIVQQPGKQRRRKIQQDNERVENTLVHATGGESAVRLDESQAPHFRLDFSNFNS
jgi:hypothetical protein